MPRADIPLGMEIAAPAAPSGVAAPTSSFELPKAVGAWAWSVQEAMQPLDAPPDDVRRRHLVVGPDGDLHGVSSLRIKAAQGQECQRKQALWRRFTCWGELGVSWRGEVAAARSSIDQQRSGFDQRSQTSSLASSDNPLRCWFRLLAEGGFSSEHVKLARPRCGSAGSGRDESAPPRLLLSRE